jgi:amino acid transporter
MMAFSAVVGIGFFLASGKVISIAGPGLAVIAWVLMGVLMWAVMSSLGEMTALFPERGAVFEFTSRFIDRGMGFSVGWMAW